MRRIEKRLAFLVCALSIASVLPAAAITVDGVLDGVGPYCCGFFQTVATQFGDSNLGQIDFANGSELDDGYGAFENGIVYLFLSGNLESNFNKLEIFIDLKPGGQNRLRGDNANVDFNGLNRMGDDGSGNGLRFDSGFEADYYLTVTGGNNPYQLFASFAELPASGGGSGSYLGQGGAGTDGTLSGGNNPHGIRVTINNRNTGGVGGGCDGSSGAGVNTGVEIAIPTQALDTPFDNGGICVHVTAFVNGVGHDFVSNQVLTLPPGTCNLGEPRNVNLAQTPGFHHFEFCPGDLAVETKHWSEVKQLYR